MTKSRKISLKILVVVLSLLMLATVLAACNDPYKPAHYDHQVSFVYNKGNLPDDTETPMQQIGVFENGLVSIWPGFDNGRVSLTEHGVNGYYIEGWYLPKEIDENGEPVKDENGFVILGDKWAFKTQRVHEDITLYCKFVKKPTILFKDMQDQYIPADTGGKIEGVPGKVVYEPESGPEKEGWTFLGKYYKNLQKEPFVWPYTFGDDDIVIYVDYLEGEWRFVSTAEEFKIAMGANKNIYLQADIDFSGVRLWDLSKYNGTINGNNHTISNVKRDIVASKMNPDNFGGVFGALGAKANIYDIKFENIEITNFEVLSNFIGVDVFVGLLAGKADSGAKLKNVTISGSLTYTSSTKYVIHAEKLIGECKTDSSNIAGCKYDQVVITEKK